jgi:Na+-transporting NADH:ubiquinone oxidoreductase subunit NqrB
MTRLTGAPAVGYLSPLITSLGLSLLLRTDAFWVGPFAAAVAISSKFVLRVRGKHVFNPANLGLAASFLLTTHAWSSPSQWGESAGLLAWIAVLGLAVSHRSFRSDVSLVFLASWVALKAGRVLYLGQRPEVLLHQLNVGSLILFAFFMISDPKTTPDRRAARVLFAACVAGLGFVLQHGFWWNNALVWSLCLLSPAVPLLDRLLPTARFQWPAERTEECPPHAVPSPSP